MEKNGGKIGSTGTINLDPHHHHQQQPVDLTGHVHLLPCSVKLTANHSDLPHYFKPRSTGIEADGLAVEEAYFRGRKLQGVTVPMPEGYSGFILGKDKGDKAASRCKIPSGTDNDWKAVAKCKSMTFWNHYSLPCQDDASLRLFHFFSVAKSLHEPIRAEDLISPSGAGNGNSQQR